MYQETSLLTYLKAILAAGSITRGAENLFISQPYLSKYISDSEQLLGFRLLNRKTRPVTLTKEGNEYIQGIENLSTEYNELLDHVMALGEETQQRITVGINQSMASIIAPPLLYRSQKAFPNQVIKIREDRSRELEQALLEKKIDFHIRMLPLFPSEIEYRILAEIPVYLIVNKSSSLFEQGNNKIRTVEIMNKHLTDIELITIISGSGFMRLVELFTSQKNIYTRPKIEVKYIETAANLAYQGLGCTFVPKYFVNNEFNSSLCNVIHIPEQQLSLKIVLSFLKGSYSEETISNFIKSTNIGELISSMNMYRYREILR